MRWWMWVILAVAAAVWTGLLAWWLWRRARNLMNTAENALSRLEEAVGQRHPDVGTLPRPIVALGDVDAARAYRNERRLARALRRQERYARYRIRWGQWSHFNE
ncbi:DUF4175 domain-containing protein [Rarobacter incanus]|uniref:Uncharacterized protein n=1 Tax=Rarobacter incanus TaxID=153494 RepID=A0A542SM82_9MICO|nr:DUF4175 domain-containing protein [Rarobacter incanus]TQK75678.1 hypothetical protein FB389_0310 [Rarobacter incanus]